jgi:CheY-like chemotaxis protein
METILIVGPAVSSQWTRQLLLESGGFRVQHVASQDALPTVRQSKFDLILLDFAVSERTEIEIAASADDSTKVIRLGEFTYPKGLLDMVGRVRTEWRP